MAASEQLVISSRPGSKALPPWASEFLFLVKHMMQQDILEETQKMGPVRRGDATDIPAIILFLLAFFCEGGGRKDGLRGFGEHIGRWRTRLAAIAGRKTLPSSSAVSRGLSALTVKQVEQIQKYLFSAGLAGSILPAHKLAVWRDANGQPWCVVDVDPTVLALRQRALPEGEEFPAPSRRAETMAAPGYTGRHRGQVIVSACRAGFSGSALWCSLSLAAGNTPLASALAAACADIAQTCTDLNIPLDRVIVRVDGAAGNVPCVTAIQTAGLHGLTRSRHYKILKHPDVQRWLRGEDERWSAVADSKSGPKREALELGIWPWEPGSRTRQPDGRAYEALAQRMVVSRHKPTKPDKKRGAGILIDGWHYELFACDLDAPAWPAAETVALYFGRAEIENRFAEENREIKLNQVFSQNLPGQALVTAIGMYVWNQRIMNGAHLAGIEDDPAFASTDGAVSRMSPVAPPALPTPKADDPTSKAVEPAPGPKQPDPISLDLTNLSWDAAMQRYPGWERTTNQLLKCPAGKIAHLKKQTVGDDGTTCLLFAMGAHDCRGCPLLPGCTTSKSPTYHKEIMMTLSPHTQATAKAAQASPEPNEPAWRPPPAQRGQSSHQPPKVIPSVLRRTWRRLVDQIETRVHISRAPKVPPTPEYVADNPARRQHRRWTWAERLAKHSLGDDDKIVIELRYLGSVGLGSGASLLAL